jgi:hypothetical protein
MSGVAIPQWYSTGLRAGWSGFESRLGLGTFFFTTVSRPALGLTNSPIQWGPEDLCVGIKLPEREGDHYPPSSAEVKNAWIHNTTSQYALMAWCSVKRKHRTTLPLPYLECQYYSKTNLQGNCDMVGSALDVCFDEIHGTESLRNW